MTGTEFINRSLRMAGQLGPGRGAGDSETVDAKLVCNSMLKSWGIERLLIYQILRDLYTLTGDLDFDFPGDTITGPRPNRIERAYGVDSGGNFTELPLLTLEQWRRKDYGLYYEPSFPQAAIHLSQAWTSLELHTWKTFQALDDLTDDLSFPDGYEDAIAYNLAVRLAIEWGRDIDPQVKMLAIQTKAAIQSLNAPEVLTSCDPAVLVFREMRFVR